MGWKKGKQTVFMVSREAFFEIREKSRVIVIVSLENVKEKRKNKKKK